MIPQFCKFYALLKIIIEYIFLIIHYIHIYFFENFSYNSTQSVQYELISAVCHIGESMNEGHYISYVKHKNKWILYDDLYVLTKTTNEVLNAIKGAYILVFKKI